jgi:hypothetical protein
MLVEIPVMFPPGPAAREEPPDPEDGGPSLPSDAGQVIGTIRRSTYLAFDPTGCLKSKDVAGR